MTCMNQALTLSTYSPLRVSIFSMSPSLMKRGTLTLYPVESVAGLVAQVTVFPFSPGAVSVTARLTKFGKVSPIGRLL